MKYIILSIFYLFTFYELPEIYLCTYMQSIPFVEVGLVEREIMNYVFESSLDRTLHKLIILFHLHFCLLKNTK